MKMHSISLAAMAACVTLLATSAPAAVQQDVLLNNTSQIRTMSNNPFFGTQQDIAAVNFYYNGTGVAAGSTVNSVGFDNVNLTGATPPTGTILLGANAPNVTLNFGMNLGISNANSERNQNANAAGADAATFNAVANRFFYVGTATDHPSANMSFNGLGANRDVYVQLIGGEGGAWNGNIGVTANGSGVGSNWTSVANSNTTTASLFAFNTTTTATGALDLGFASSNGLYAGIAGVLISGDGIVSPAAAVGGQAQLSSTSQILAPSGDFDRLAAAVNFVYTGQSGTVAPGSVNGIDFQDIDWVGGTQALTEGGSITVSGDVATFRTRSQFTATTISGPDEAVLESIANTLSYLGANESLTIDITGLDADTDVLLQLIGGDEGWAGDLTVDVNGESTLWDLVADGNNATASLLTLYGTTDANGDLQITVDGISNYAGIAGLTVSQATIVPEPSSIALWTLLGLLSLLGLGWKQRRGRTASASQ